MFYSYPLANDGFVNISIEVRDRNSTNRAGPDQERNGEVSLRFGDAASQDGLLAINAERPIRDTPLYLQGIANRRESSATATYRHADNDDVNIPEIYPEGFLSTECSGI